MPVIQRRAILPAMGILILLPGLGVSGCGTRAAQSSRLWSHGEAWTNRRLAEALEAENADLRRHALLSLVGGNAIEAPQAFRALDLIARTDSSSSVRQAAVAVFESYRDDRPVETLLKLLHCADHPESVRPIDDPLAWRTIETLATLADRGLFSDEQRTAVEQALVHVLRNSTDHHVRLSSVRTLSRFDSGRVIGALVDAVGSRDFGVAYEARQALVRLTGTDEGLDPEAWLDRLGRSERARANSPVEPAARGPVRPAPERSEP